ncbi:MAG: RNA 2',3'-cyclic phosphodiesterase [DPANN group archaeon]|nr:RNA 2',3'-cyclic phosphodiesterase [DPANN group archaeon]
MRCFFCFDIPYAIRRGLVNMQVDLAERLDNFNYIKSDNMHITLKYLGNVDEHLIQKINSVLTPKLERYMDLELDLENVGVFPNVEDARVLWVGVKENKKLLEIYNTIGTVLEKFGFTHEIRFIPHVTLGRFKKSCDVKKLETALSDYNTFVSKPFKLNEVLLKDSTLTPLGIVYSIKNRFSFLSDSYV